MCVFFVFFVLAMPIKYKQISIMIQIMMMMMMNLENCLVQSIQFILSVIPHRNIVGNIQQKKNMSKMWSLINLNFFRILIAFASKFDTHKNETTTTSTTKQNPPISSHLYSNDDDKRSFQKSVLKIWPQTRVILMVVNKKIHSRSII